MATEIEAWAAIRRLAPAWVEGEGCGYAAVGANGLVPGAAGWARGRERRTISHNENGLPNLVWQQMNQLGKTRRGGAKERGPFLC